MNIYYCENCGVRISEADLPRGLDPRDERLKLCPKHRAKGSNLNVPIAAPEIKSGSNSVLPGARPSSLRVKSQKPLARSGDGTAQPDLKIKVVAGLAAVGVLVFTASLFSGKETPKQPAASVTKAPEAAPPKTPPTAHTSPPTNPALTPTAVVAKADKPVQASPMGSDNSLTRTKPDVTPRLTQPAVQDPPVDPKVAATGVKPAQPVMGFMAGDAGDIREELAQGHLDDLIAQEKEGKFSPRQLRAAYSKFIASNASTKAGHDAEARLKALPAPPPLVVAGLKDGLIACWGLDDTGLDVVDRSGHDTLGTVVGATRTTDKANSALSFDGNGNAVSFPSEPFRQITKNFTITCWAKPGAERAQTQETTIGVQGVRNQRYAIFPTQGGSAYGGDSEVCVGVSIGTNGISVFEHGNGHLPSTLVHNAAISDWTYVVVTYDNNKPTLYVNGVLAKEGVAGGKNTHPGSSLGGSPYGWYLGLLGEVRVYNRALTADEIKGLFDLGQK